MRDSQQRISTETALRLLVKQERRQIIRRLADTPNGVTAGELAREFGEPAVMYRGGDGEQDRRSIQLHHVHLPMLEAANVIVYDDTRGAVRRGEQFRAVRSLLESVDGHRDSPSTNIS